MTESRFDELIHAPTRLSIVSLLGASDWAEFKFIRDTLGLSDSALSKQLTVLEDAGYVEIRKGFVGKRPRTWARLSRAGRAAFDGHVRRLLEIVSQAPAAPDPGREMGSASAAREPGQPSKPGRRTSTKPTPA